MKTYLTHILGAVLLSVCGALGAGAEAVDSVVAGCDVKSAPQTDTMPLKPRRHGAAQVADAPVAEDDPALAPGTAEGRGTRDVADVGATKLTSAKGFRQPCS